MSSLRDKLLGSVIMTVGKYKRRLTGQLRGYDNRGVRLDCHHVPHDGTIAVPREEGIAIAVPEDVHQSLHNKRWKHIRKETLKQQVENDYDYLRDKLTRHGYSDDLIDESLAMVHESNEKFSYKNPFTGERVTINLYEQGKRHK